MKKAFYLLLVIIILTGAVLLVKKRSREINAQIPRRIPFEEVQSAKVESGSFSIKRHYIGSIEAEESAVIISRVQARVANVLKHEGDKIKRGDILIELDSNEGNRVSLKRRLSILNIQKQNSKKIVSNLRDALYRDEILYKSGGISKEQLQITENRLLEAESKLQSINIQIEELETLLSFYSIKAPYDGVVSEVYVREGDTVLQGRPLVKIEHSSNYKVVVKVDTDSVRHIKKGYKAIVKYKDRSISTIVNRVYPSVSQGAGTVEIKLDGLPFDLPSGAFVDVYLEIERLDRVFIVPEDALLFNGDRAILYKLTDKNEVEGIEVSLLGKSNSMVAIKGALKAGDIVVRADESTLLKLSTGTKVKVIYEKTDT